MNITADVLRSIEAEISDLRKSRSDALFVVEAADKLELFLGRNSGSSADWPMALKCDNDETADELTALLQTLHTALKPYREHKTNANQASP